MNKLYPLLFALLCIKQASAQSVSVSPARIFFKGFENGELTQYVTLVNTGNNPLLLKASVKDWERDSLGNKVYYAPGTLPRTNTNWLRVVPDVVELMPGETKKVLVSLKVQDEYRTDKVTNSMLFFTQINDQSIAAKSKGKSMGIRIKVEMGVHIYHTPNKLYEKNIDFLAFRDLGFVTSDSGRVRRLSLKMKNTGDLVLDGELRFELTETKTGKEYKFKGKPTSLLPGAIQVAYMDIPELAEGESFLAVAIFDSGTEMNLKVAEKKFRYD